MSELETQATEQEAMEAAARQPDQDLIDDEDDELTDEWGNPIEQPEPEGGEEEGEAASEQKAEADAKAQAENPETLRIGDEDVPLETVLADRAEMTAIRDRVAPAFESAGIEPNLETVVGFFETLHGAYSEFYGSPQGAEKVINAWVADAIATHGDKLPTVEPVDLRDFRPDHLTGPARQLYGGLQHLAEQNKALVKQNQELVKLAREAEAERNRAAEEPKLVEAVRARYPDARVTAQELRSLMAKHKVSSPVQAYQLENIDSLGKTEVSPKKGPADTGAKGSRGAERKVPNLPKTEKAMKQVDARGMSLRERIRYAEAGYELVNGPVTEGQGA